MDSAKKPYQSKTIILNTIVGVSMALSAFLPQLSTVKTFVEGHAIEIGTCWSILGIILRTISKDKIALTE